MTTAELLAKLSESCAALGRKGVSLSDLKKSLRLK